MEDTVVAGPTSSHQIPDNTRALQIQLDAFFAASLCLLVPFQNCMRFVAFRVVFVGDFWDFGSGPFSMNVDEY